jgi:hypothetical protein
MKNSKDELQQYSIKIMCRIVVFSFNILSAALFCNFLHLFECVQIFNPKSCLQIVHLIFGYVYFCEFSLFEL